MVGHRWGRTLAPGILAIGATAALVASTVAARDRPWTPAACAGDGAVRVTAARIAAPRDPLGIAGEPWFRADPRLDGDGALAGQRLVVGRRGARRAGDHRPAAGVVRRRSVRRPGPRRRGRRGRLQAARRSTRSPAAAPRSTRPRTSSGGRPSARTDRPSTRLAWRGGTAPTSGSGRVRSTGRRRPGPSSRRRPPTAASGGRGRRSSPGRSRATGSWSSRAARCPAGRGCSTRPTARSELVDDPALGPMVGVAGGRVIAFGACRGFPCPLVATDVATGARQRPGRGVRAGRRGAGRERRTGRPRDRRRPRPATACRRPGRVGRAPTSGPSPTDSGWDRSAAGRAAASGCRPAGSCSPRTAACRSPPRDPRPTLRHVPDGRSVPLDEVSR